MPDTSPLPVPGSSPREPDCSQRAVMGAIWRYRALTYITGTGLLVLCLIGMPLQYASHNPVVADITIPIHGFTYVVYLAVAYDMTRRLQWPISRLVPVVLAGFVPGLAFLIERRTTPGIVAEIRAEQRS